MKDSSQLRNFLKRFDISILINSTLEQNMDDTYT